MARGPARVVIVLFAQVVILLAMGVAVQFFAKIAEKTACIFVNIAKIVSFVKTAGSHVLVAKKLFVIIVLLDVIPVIREFARIILPIVRYVGQPNVKIVIRWKNVIPVLVGYVAIVGHILNVAIKFGVLDVWRLIRCGVAKNLAHIVLSVRGS